ncbi:MAG: FABP family protein [Candidatus Nanopelagicales bacterium]
MEASAHDASGTGAAAGANESVLPLELAPVAWLLGKWAGVGLGQYPTIEEFRFFQEVTVTTDGRPFLTYHSRSWIVDDEGERIRPSGTEVGYLRPLPDNEVEFLLQHPTGITEVWFGRVEVTGLTDSVITGARLQLSTDGIMRTPTAKEVSAGLRLYGLVEGDLLWTYDMAAVGQPMQNHLSARLKRA